MKISKRRWGGVSLRGCDKGVCGSDGGGGRWGWGVVFGVPECGVGGAGE